MISPRDECHCFAIRQAARKVTQLYDAHLARAGLRATQFSLLAKLSRLGGASIHELASEMGMDRTTLGRAIRPLERDGLVAIGAAEDARARALSLTESGEAKLEAATKHWREAQREFEASFGVDAAASLRATLRDLAGAI